MLAETKKEHEERAKGYRDGLNGKTNVRLSENSCFYRDGLVAGTIEKEQGKSDG